MYEKNVGQIDRIVRVVLAVIFAIIIVYIATLSTIGLLEWTVAFIFAIIGLIFLVTAIFGSCPIYSLLKFNTNKT